MANEKFLIVLKQSAVGKLKQAVVGGSITPYEQEKPDWESVLGGEEYKRKTQVALCGKNLSACFDEKTYGDKDDVIKNDPKRCVALYEALKNLTPQQATSAKVWTYLTHFVFWDYARARWPLPKESRKKKASILSHFFVKDLRGMVRDNALSRLWWMAHICKQVENEPLEDVLSALLRTEDVRKEVIERASFCRSSPILKALMKFMLLSHRGNGQLHDRGKFRDLCKHLNRKGGIVVLDAMQPKQLEDIIKKIIEKDLELDPNFPKN